MRRTDAGIALFRVAYLLGFVNLFAGKSEVGCGRNQTVPIRNGFRSTVLSNFAPFLRGVVWTSKEINLRPKAANSLGPKTGLQEITRPKRKKGIV